MPESKRPVQSGPVAWMIKSLRLRLSDGHMVAKAARRKQESWHGYARRVLLESAARDTGKEAA